MSELETLNWQDWDSVLVVVAHPDDAEYGLSAAVKEWTDAGIEVSYLLLTHGEAGIQGLDPAETGPLCAAEQQTACDIVGVNNLTILDHPDSMLVYNLELRKEVAREIRIRKPNAVVLSNFEVEAYGGLNQADHRVAGLAGIDGTRDAANPWAQRELLDEGLQPWSTSLIIITGHDEPTHTMDLNPESVAAGVASLEAHKRYLEALPHHPKPAEFIPEVLRTENGFAKTFRVFGV
ncbi:PIG-L deacetylase family protein [Corynebacterium callunae]|uniref:PIG-L deacetylase family protein n=1 Tax=Corynebacterium callunae TaxID=1721 RepID=UPI001FFEDE5F|nr:PIG-L deacetylase family protein [Corynebacterium callunae]MCK2201108.1 PIG-L family deacetylase [Corynebacterium callunae]